MQLTTYHSKRSFMLFFKSKLKKNYSSFESGPRQRPKDAHLPVPPPLPRPQGPPHLPQDGGLGVDARRDEIRPPRTTGTAFLLLWTEVSSLIRCDSVFEFLVHFFCYRNQKVNQDWGASRQLSLGSLFLCTKNCSKIIRKTSSSLVVQKWTKIEPKPNRI